MTKAPREQMFAHVSRLYSSGFTALVTTIFGWVTYLGFFINFLSNARTQLNTTSLANNSILVNQQIGNLKVGFVIIGIFLAGCLFFFYYRLLFFGKFLGVLAQDLKILHYANELHPKGFLKKYNTRKENEVNTTSLECALGIFLVIMVVISIIVIFSFW
jgi:hypothetical protein